MSGRAARVAVLGGGCAGVAAAFELSKTPELRRSFEVTLYEASPRLGGKGATTRNAAWGQRIEEHGLHLWLGFYARAFRLMRDCYAELEQSPWRSPAEAFAPHFSATMAAAGARAPWRLTLPARPGQPWDAAAEPRDRWSNCVQTLLAGLRSWPACQQWPGEQRGSRTASLAWIDQLGCLGLQAQLALALARGLAHDVLARPADGFAAIDHLDLCAWLERWGARRSEVHDAPPIRALYNLAFAYPDGIAGHGRGQIAAGAALRALLQLLFGYRGAPFWRMRAGMGDTVFAPLYRLLLQRGVRVELCHEVRRLLAAPAEASLAAVDLRFHERPAAAPPVLERVKDLQCWPGEPPWGAAGAGTNSALRERRLVQDQDFDAVILAIPAPCHRGLAGELLARSGAYREMMDHTHSVATLAAQLWLREPLRELGWSERSTIYTSGPRPLGSWAEMSEVLEYEHWPAGHEPQAVVYLCDACPDELIAVAGDPQRKAALLERVLQQWSQLLSPSRTARPKARLVGELGDQYLRVNHRPTERYVLSLPGTTRYRLAPDESGIERLYFAGDWTRTSINGGSVEAAVESGQTAAQCLIRRWG